MATFLVFVFPIPAWEMGDRGPFPTFDIIGIRDLAKGGLWQSWVLFHA